MHDPTEIGPANEAEIQSLPGGRDDDSKGTTPPPPAAGAAEARERGMQLAEYATDVAWTAACDTAIQRLAASGDEFTADEVIAVVGPPVAPSGKVVGSRFARAARGDLIRAVGYRPSLRAPGRILRVWVGQGVAS